MALYQIPLTILATIEVRASDRMAAAGLAVRYVDGALSCLSGGFTDGWNDMRQPGDGYVNDFTGGDIEGMHRLGDEAIELDGPTWAVEPQRDLNADIAPDSEGTRFEACEEADATQFALFETFEGNTVVVEDYPTRAAAEAAAEALRNGDPLPTPVWPVSEAMTNLEAAARAIIRQRDYFADHAEYDQSQPHPDGACFDDWAADSLETALAADRLAVEG